MRDPFVFQPGDSAQTGRVGLVVGGDGVVGRTVAEALASRGHAVAVHAHGAVRQARELAAALGASGVRSLAVTADLRDDAAVRALVHRVADHFGRIDAVVTCSAGVRQAVFEDVTAAELRVAFDVHCVGPFVVAQEAAAVMVRQPEGGGIVLVEDADAFLPGRGLTAAAAGRGSLPVVVRGLAVELALRHPRVRVNGVLAGAVGPEDRSSGTAGPPGTAGHVAHAVAFLLENEFVTGVVLPVDGGRGLACRREEEQARTGGS